MLVYQRVHLFMEDNEATLCCGCGRGCTDSSPSYSYHGENEVLSNVVDPGG